MRRLLTVPLLVLACAALALLTAAKSDEKGLKTYEIVLDNSFGLVEGGDLKIGGVKAGKTSGFRLTESEPYRTIVTVEVSEPGFDSLRTDARCDVRQQSLIGEYFIDCDLGENKEEIPDGGRIGVKNTSSTIPPDLINNVMRRPYRERFRLILSELGTGLAGRPEELNEVIRRAHPALRELSQTITILRRQNKVISDFVRDADAVSEAVEPLKEDVARWAVESSDTAEIQASRSEELGRYWNRLPEFLKELRPTLAELERTADRQIPTLRSLQRAAPDLERFLIAAQPFARNTRGSIRALGSASEVGSEAIRQSSEEIGELRRLAKFAPRLGKPLRQFLQALDDRKRSIENDPAAARVAPPAPDKTAYKPGQGFTGMEAFWNYIYFQTLAINAFDEIGHLLRIVQIQGDPCAPYNPSPNQEEIDNCASWLGPSQPGVGNNPDYDGETGVPTAPAPGAGPSKRRAARPPTDGTINQDAARRPAPGQRDLSKPQIRLPRELRELLDRVGGSLPDARDRLPVAPEAVPPGVLDYLLGP